MLQIFTFTKEKNNFLIAKSINILLMSGKKACLCRVFVEYISP